MHDTPQATPPIGPRVYLIGQLTVYCHHQSSYTPGTRLVLWTRLSHFRSAGCHPAASTLAPPLEGVEGGVWERELCGTLYLLQCVTTVVDPSLTQLCPSLIKLIENTNYPERMRKDEAISFVHLLLVRSGDIGVKARCRYHCSAGKGGNLPYFAF